MIYDIGIPPNVSATAATSKVNVLLFFVKTISSPTAYPCPGFVITIAVESLSTVVRDTSIPVPEPVVDVCVNPVTVLSVAAPASPDSTVSSVKLTTEPVLSPLTPAIVILDFLSS